VTVILTETTKRIGFVNGRVKRPEHCCCAIGEPQRSPEVRFWEMSHGPHLQLRFRGARFRPTQVSRLLLCTRSSRPEPWKS